MTDVKFLSRAIGNSFKSGGPILEYKSQMKYFTAFDISKNRAGKTHPSPWPTR